VGEGKKESFCLNKIPGCKEGEERGGGVSVKIGRRAFRGKTSRRRGPGIKLKGKKGGYYNFRGGRKVGKKIFIFQ